MADTPKTVYEKLIDTLDTFNVPVYRQGSMSQNATYPETFITFWNNDTPDHAYYDNKAYGTSWSVNVYVYSSDANKPYSLIEQIRTALMSEGWIVPSRGFDADSDEESHIGRGIECLYLDV